MAGLIAQFGLEGREAELFASAVTCIEAAPSLPLMTGESAKADERRALNLAARLSEHGKQTFKAYLGGVAERISSGSD